MLKAVLWGKFIAQSVYIKTSETWINDSIMQIKNLEKIRTNSIQIHYMTRDKEN